MAGPGHLGPGDIETIIGDGREKRRQPADPFNFPFLPCPHRNGGIGQGPIRQWLAPVALPSLPALQRPGFRSDRSTAGWPCSRSASCPHQQVRGGSQAPQASDTGTSPRPWNTSPGFPSYTSSGGLPPWSAAQRKHHQSGQPGSADKPRPTGRCRNRRVCNPSGCREACYCKKSTSSGAAVLASPPPPRSSLSTRTGQSSNEHTTSISPTPAPGPQAQQRGCGLRPACPEPPPRPGPLRIRDLGPCRWP